MKFKLSICTKLTSRAVLLLSNLNMFCHLMSPIQNKTVTEVVSLLSRTYFMSDLSLASEALLFILYYYSVFLSSLL